MEKDSVKVNCDYCGKEIECPKNLLETSKSHMCHGCFRERAERGNSEPLKDVHVDIPTDDLIEDTAERMVNTMVEAVFPSVWDDRKIELKPMPKKDLAREMFGSGAYLALSTLMKMQHDAATKEENGASKKNG